MHFKLITHDRIVFDEDVNEIYTRGVDGEFGVLENHVPMMTALDVGVTRLVKDGKLIMFTTMGGIFQFKDNNALILTDIAETGNDIDITRAKQAKERAEARLADKSAEIDAHRAESALARAKARLKVALSSQHK
jgi:F-type H+-transporting ATPase subunit epsilon